MSTICPICKQANYCGINNQSKCWCTEVIIEPKIFARVPEEFLRKSCICKKCIIEFNKQFKEL